MPSYRFKCPKCNYEDLRHMSRERFQKKNDTVGHACPRCSWHRMSACVGNIRIRDSFKPGWQENIQMYVDSRSKYNKVLKERGLVELGTQDIEITDEIPGANDPILAADGVLKECYDLGIELSGREISAIKSGEYFQG